MFLIAALAVLIVIAAYWLHFRVWENHAISKITAALLLAMLVVLVYVQRPNSDALQKKVPTLIAIATDVSLSMGTTPDPRVAGDAATRLERAQRVLLTVLSELDASTMPVMISVTAFTVKSETILAWDDNISQIREAIQYVLSTELLTDPGSDLGAGVRDSVPLFDNLPEAYRDAKQSKYLIVVSDGEQTVPKADLATAMADLREHDVKIISLNVGLTDIPEGLPVYDDSGNFVGFDEVGGKMYSVPDPQVMKLLAGEDPAYGLFVKAESSDAADAILDFIGIQSARSASEPLYVALVLVLWGLTTVVLLRFA